MKSVAILTTMMAVVSGLPAKLDTLAPLPGEAPDTTPVLVKDVDDMHIEVSEPQAGKYNVEVFRLSDRSLTRLPTKNLTLPPGWHLKGRESSLVVHAELISTGDVVVVLFGLEHGLDLVLLPKEFFRSNSPEAIVFPEVSVPWHPTLSTPTEKWSWSPFD
nr:uncharacterized protein LOC128693970 [Cherax quadricarinatus]